MTDERALGRYRLIRELGRGAAGVVYLAEHASLRRQVALKVLRPERVGDRESLARFRNEAVAVNRVRHPHIVELIETGLSDDGPYLVMEYVRGRDLAQVVRALRGQRGGQALPLAHALTIASAVASGLHHAHEQRGERAAHQRPNRPAGRTARASSRMPNETASDHDGPKNVDMRLSMTPRTTAATRVPPMLPMPPRTVIANIRPM
jgi:serine/threonine protein kinase